MAFGQSSGPPATGKQLSELLELLAAVGHSDFRDARGPMGFTQRQAGGKFTRDEADEFIAQLQSEVDGVEPPEQEPGSGRAGRPSKIAPRSSKVAPRSGGRERPSKIASGRKAANVSASKRSTSKIDLSEVPAEDLAAELQQRGWAVLEP